MSDIPFDKNRIFADVVKLELKAWKHYAFCFLPNFQEAEDLVADLLEDVWKHLDRMEVSHISLRAYISVAIKRRCFNYFRDRKRSYKIKVLGGNYIDDDRYTYEDVPEVDRNEGLDRLKSALQIVNKLPEKQSDIIVLYYLREMSLKQVGDSLGITPSTVGCHLHKARIRAHSMSCDIAATNLPKKYNLKRHKINQL